MRAKAKYIVGQLVHVSTSYKITHKIREVYWDKLYAKGSWRYRMEGESDHWVPIQELLSPLTRTEKGWK